MTTTWRRNSSTTAHNQSCAPYGTLHIQNLYKYEYNFYKLAKPDDTSQKPSQKMQCHFKTRCRAPLWLCTVVRIVVRVDVLPGVANMLSIDHVYTWSKIQHRTLAPRTRHWAHGLQSVEERASDVIVSFTDRTPVSCCWLIDGDIIRRRFFGYRLCDFRQVVTVQDILNCLLHLKPHCFHRAPIRLFTATGGQAII